MPADAPVFGALSFFGAGGSMSDIGLVLYFSVGDIYTPEERLEGTKSDETHVEAPHLVEIQCQRQLEHATKASYHP